LAVERGSEAAILVKPSQRKLARKLGASRTSLQRAIGEMTAAGARVHRLLSFVTPNRAGSHVVKNLGRSKLLI
jgi:DNA-binding GntR family transcriptional regulator